MEGGASDVDDLAHVTTYLLSRMSDQMPRALVNSVVTSLWGAVTKRGNRTEEAQAVEAFLNGSSEPTSHALVERLLGSVLEQNQTLAQHIAAFASRDDVAVRFGDVSARDISIQVGDSGGPHPPQETVRLIVDAKRRLDTSPSSPPMRVLGALLNPTIRPISVTFSIIDLTDHEDSALLPVVLPPAPVPVPAEQKAKVAFLVDAQPGHRPGKRDVIVQAHAGGMQIDPVRVRIRILEERSVRTVLTARADGSADAVVTNVGNAFVTVNVDICSFAVSQGSLEVPEDQIGTSLNLGPGEHDAVPFQARRHVFQPHTVQVLARTEGEGVTSVAPPSIPLFVPPLISVKISAFLALLTLLGLAAWVGMAVGEDSNETTSKPSTAVPVDAATSSSSDGAQTLTLPEGYTFAVPPVAATDHCAQHATGRVAEVLRTTRCGDLERFVASTTLEGRDVLIAGARFETEGDVEQIVDVLNAAGTGDVTSLLAERAYA
jgi:hypothetical protein